MTIPTIEPTTLRAGDTWQWRREDLTDYPATSWLLSYRFKNSSGGFQVDATADGTAFAVDVDDITSARYAAGDYQWQARVNNGAETFTVGGGTTTVTPSFFSGTESAALDTRSTARKIVDNIDAMLAGRATIDQQEYEIQTGGGALRRMKYCTKDELLALRSTYAAIAAREESDARAAAGYPDKRRSYVRFSGRV